MGKIRPGQKVPTEIRELFEKHRKYIAAGRANYKRADAALESLLERCEAGVSVTLDPTSKKGKPETHTLVDQFADTNSVWAGSSAKRFKIEAKAVKPQDEPGTAKRSS